MPKRYPIRTRPIAVRKGSPEAAALLARADAVDRKFRERGRVIVTNAGTAAPLFRV
jgi:hypothetical protein